MYIHALINEAPKKILKVAMILELGVNSIKCYDKNSLGVFKPKLSFKIRHSLKLTVYTDFLLWHVFVYEYCGRIFG